MNVTVNGKPFSYTETELSIIELTKRHDVKQPDMVSVQLNGQFLDRPKFAETLVREGDEIEFLYFMGGGQPPVKKISIISFSGDFDKLVAAFTLATGSAAVGYEVNLFFTFWGLNILKKKKGRAFTGKGLLARTFGFLMGGPSNLPLSRLNFGGISPKLMSFMMRKRNVATLNELVEAAKELGINLYPCEMSMHILGITKDDFIPEVKEVLGVARFLEISEGGDRIFI